MTKLTKTGLLAGAIFCVFGQAKAYDLNVIRQYYHYVYKAEHCIIFGDYRSASGYYDSAFGLDFKLFAIDLHNSALCSAFNNDNKTLLERAEMLVDKGANLPYFDRTDYEAFRKSPEWRKLLAEMPDLVNKRNEHQDTQLIARINAMIVRDEIMDITEFKNGNEVKFVDKVMRMDDSLGESLARMMEQNDYLSEERIGSFRKEALAGYTCYGDIINDQFQKHYTATKQAIEEAIRKGKLRAPTGIAWLVEHSNSPKIIYTDDYCMINDSLWAPLRINEVRTNLTARLLDTDDDRLATFREGFYMDTPENIVEKVKFTYHNALKWQRQRPRLPFCIYEPPSFGGHHIPISHSDFRVVDWP